RSTGREQDRGRTLVRTARFQSDDTGHGARPDGSPAGSASSPRNASDPFTSRIRRGNGPLARSAMDVPAVRAVERHPRENPTRMADVDAGRQPPGSDPRVHSVVDRGRATAGRAIDLAG